MLTHTEYLRQLLHIAVGLVTVILIHIDILTPLSIFLLILLGVTASILSKFTRIPGFDFFLKHLERKENKNFPGKGLIFFFIGVLLAVKLFPRDIALASIMVLTLGDSISHIIGARYGKIRNIFNGNSKKLFEGTFAGTITGFLGALLFVPIPEAFLGSAAAMIAEVLEIELNHNQLDDNLTVPLVAGAIMVLVRSYL